MSDRDHWYLEFVGGPLDGRQDISTPVDAFEWHYAESVPMKMQVVVAAFLEKVSPYGPPPMKIHVYRRSQIRSCGPEWDGNNGYWQEIIQEVWIFHDYG